MNPSSDSISADYGTFALLRSTLNYQVFRLKAIRHVVASVQSVVKELEARTISTTDDTDCTDKVKKR
jgi:hypothetical protein